MKKQIFNIGFLLIGIIISSCVSVKDYQKTHLNDEEMKLENRQVEVFESDFQSYREGAVGGTNGNSGSGCGCN
jgi:hypothetical protein